MNIFWILKENDLHYEGLEVIGEGVEFTNGKFVVTWVDPTNYQNANTTVPSEQTITPSFIIYDSLEEGKISLKKMGATSIAGAIDMFYRSYRLKINI